MNTTEKLRNINPQNANESLKALTKSHEYRRTKYIIP